MRNFLLLLGFLFISFSAVAQSDPSKEKFMKEIFTNFKKNKLDEISKYFIDSVFLGEMITQIFEKEELPPKFTREKIYGERLQAAKRFRESLQNAYDELYAEGGKDLKRAKPEMEVYGKQSKPVESFGFRYKFIVNSKKAKLRISQIVYDKNRNRYVILADKVRVSLVSTDDNLRIEEVVEEAVVEEAVAVDDAAAAVEAAAEAVEETVVDIENMEVEVAQPDYGNQNKVFEYAEQMPSFPGGESALKEWLANNTLFPPQMAESTVVGNVYVQFIVGKDGSLNEPKVIRNLGLGTGKEALRLVKKMPKWLPGKNRGQAVNVRYTLPIPFGQY